MSVEKLKFENKDGGEKEGRFDRVLKCLQEKGIEVEVIPSDELVHGAYDYKDDRIRVHKGNFFEIVEESVHRAQCEAAKEEGFESESSMNLVLLAGEIGAINWQIMMRRKEIGELFQKAQVRKLKEGEIRMLNDLEQERTLERHRLFMFLENLHRELEKLDKEELSRYKELFGNPLFSGAKVVIEWVEEGIKSEDMWGEEEA